jgi:hypothetical protein
LAGNELVFYLFTGAPSLPTLFIGITSVGFSITLPAMRKITGVFTAFEITVIDLLITPILLVEYFTLMVSLLPGSMGSRGHLGTVQPQLDLTSESTRGSLPVFLKAK